MSSIPWSMSESYPESIPYAESQPESIPLSERNFTPDDTQNVEYDEIKFQKQSNDKIKIYVKIKNKNKNYISKEITFSKFKKRNNIKYEDIDTFLNEINYINNKKNNIIVYFNELDYQELRIKYLNINNNKSKSIPIIFITKEESKIEKKKIIKEKENNPPNNIIINNEIIAKPKKEKNIDSNIEEKLKTLEVILNFNKSGVKYLQQKIPLILYKNKSFISSISNLLNVNKDQIDFELLYSLKRDGDEIEIFHKFVKKYETTLLLFETYDKEYYLYYIPESWESSNVNESQIKKNEKIFLYNFKSKKKYEKKNYAIFCYKSYGPMIGEYNNDETEFINNLDFDCSMSLKKVFTSKKNIFKTANNFNQFELKELEVYKFNIY